jgi:hypothetical protein
MSFNLKEALVVVNDFYPAIVSTIIFILILGYLMRDIVF